MEGGMRPKDLRKARIYFGRAMEEGHLAAGLEYAEMCMNGDGGDRNIAESFRAYREVIKRHFGPGRGNKPGVREAQLTLGDMYFMGEGTERNYHEALRCYLAAEELGQFGREGRIAYMYEHGIGIERDLVTAAIWYQKAVIRHNANAIEPCKRIMSMLSAEDKRKVGQAVEIKIS